MASLKGVRNGWAGVLAAAILAVAAGEAGANGPEAAPFGERGFRSEGLAGPLPELVPQAPSSLAAAGAPEAGAEESDPGSEELADGPELSDLTVLNFFTEGWNQPWAHRHRMTPDMALFRVTTNFLEREFRFDYQGARHVNHNAKVQRTDFAQALIAYGLNRRLMIEVIASYQWNHKDGLNIVDGPGAGALTRFQLVDTEMSSYAVQLKVTAPNKSIGQTGATISPAITGWTDLDALAGLDRVGLYYSINWDNVSGPHAHPAQTNVLSYDISVAKTWTELSTPVLGNLTTFLEGFLSQAGDGPTAHRTQASLTPGIRFWFVPENSLSLGVDLPVSYPHAQSEVYRITYILNF